MLAALALGLAALVAHSALMSSDMGHHMADSAAVCLAIGGCTLLLGVATFAGRRPSRRPVWLAAAPVLAASGFIAVLSGFLVRAGPRSRSQVFRL